MTGDRTLRVIEAISAQAEWDPWLSLKGLADYFSLSRRTLQDLVNDHVDPLPSFRVGGKILVRMSEADAWMARRRNAKALAVVNLARADATALLVTKILR